MRRNRLTIRAVFLDDGTRYATDHALSGLVRSGDVLRLGRGLYYYPVKS